MQTLNGHRVEHDVVHKFVLPMSKQNASTKSSGKNLRRRGYEEQAVGHRDLDPAEAD
jgi:hypothetical protein